MIFNNEILIVINREIICTQVIKTKRFTEKNYFEKVYVNTFSKNKRITLLRGLMWMEFVAKNAQQTITPPHPLSLPPSIKT